MEQSTELLFQTLFNEMVEPRIVVFPDAPHFTVVTSNKAYTLATGLNTIELKGQSLWQFFKADTASINGRSVFEDGLNDAIRHKAEIKLPIFRFDTPAQGALKAKARWWQVDIMPVKDDAENVIYLICTTRNVTLHVEDQAAIIKGEQDQAAILVRQQETTAELGALQGRLNVTQDKLNFANQNIISAGKRNQELSESEYRLNRIVDTTPCGLSIIKGRELIIETINEPLLKIWGRSKEAALGKSLINVLPELQGQPFQELLYKVFDTGEPIRLNKQAAVIVLPDGNIKNIFVDFSYDPLFDLHEQVDAVLVTVNDVTNMVKAQKLLQDREEELEVMNEELTSTNEELAAANEELYSGNEELTSINEELQKAYQELQALKQSNA